MTTLKVYRREPKGLIYASPVTSYTARFKTQHAKQVRNNVQVDHFKTEVILNEPVNHEVGSVTITDPVSVRLSVSGSNLSQPRIKEILKALSDQVVVWSDENVYLGFEPESAPLIPVTA